MLFTNVEATGKQDLHHYRTEIFEVYYTGFFFLPGFPNGIDTLKELLVQIETTDLGILKDLYGVYFMTIRDYSKLIFLSRLSQHLS